MKTVDRIIDIIASMCCHDGSHLNTTSSLIQDCGMDSLEIMDLALQVEDDFGVGFTDREVDDMVTIGDIARMLKEKGIEE